MSEKRFKSTIDEETMSIMPYLVSDEEEECFYNLEGCVDLLNEQQATINKQNELIELIANACTYSKEHSVKEILRKEIKGIDTVTYESANAWNDYVLLSEFFEKHYKEYWDNEI